MSFRFPPPNGMSGEALDKYFEETMGDLEAALDEILVPDRMDHVCHAYAIEQYMAYERFGLPYSGGHAEQPALDMFVLQCVLTAKERADRVQRAIEEQERAAQQETAGQEGQTYG